SQAFFLNETTYGGATAGHGAWADYPWYGTEKFFFIEDNTIKRINPRFPRGLTDTLVAGRFVVRHNYIQDCMVGNHGTEGGALRGGRICEVYDNTFNFTIFARPGGLRSGTTMWHDNVITGVEPDALGGFQNFRETPARTHSLWGIADGT